MNDILILEELKKISRLLGLVLINKDEPLTSMEQLYKAGFKYLEIAEMFDTTPRSVESSLYRYRKQQKVEQDKKNKNR